MVFVHSNFPSCRCGWDGISDSQNQLPAFGRDTVWYGRFKIWSMRPVSFVRIAQFCLIGFLNVGGPPSKREGTIFMPNSSILEARGYVNSRSFQVRADAKSKNATTLWLSHQIYRDLKEKKRSNAYWMELMAI